MVSVASARRSRPVPPDSKKKKVDYGSRFDVRLLHARRRLKVRLAQRRSRLEVSLVHKNLKADHRNDIMLYLKSARVLWRLPI